jgi:hypothetical protein
MYQRSAGGQRSTAPGASNGMNSLQSQHGATGTAPGESSASSWSSTDTCASLFPRTRKLKVDIEMSLDDLEKTRGGLNEVMMAKLTRDLSEFFMNIEQMQEFLSKEYNQRDMWQK